MMKAHVGFWMGPGTENKHWRKTRKEESVNEMWALAKNVLALVHYLEQVHPAKGRGQHGGMGCGCGKQVHSTPVPRE